MADRASLINAVTTYLDTVCEVHATGHAREHAYRPAQITLFDTFDDTLTLNDAAKSQAGFPDFTFLKRSQTEMSRGYGEGKDLDANLDSIEKTEQLLNYGQYENLLLTNGLEFRFYRSGERISPPIALATLNKKTSTITPHSQVYDEFADALSSFLNQVPEKITSAPQLATIMAGKARRIRAITNRLLEEGGPQGNRDVQGVYQLVTRTLADDMNMSDFADMYAQTLVYGLFAARFHDKSPGTFSRQKARDLIATETEFLKAFFDHIAGASFPEDLKLVVNELCLVLSVSDVRRIVTRQIQSGDHEGRDPIIHFYEMFLCEYDAEQRKDRGVYYTPTPVVRYIVRTVDRILAEKFGIPDGLADASKKTYTVEVSAGNRFKPKIEKKITTGAVTQQRTLHRVQILDPAVGTATFLNEAIKTIHAKFTGQHGLWPAYVKDDLIPRLFGFELMMAPYAIAHLKLAMTLAELGYDGPTDTLGVYLTNTLDKPADLNPDLFTFGLEGAFSREAMKASEVKTERPIMVVLGNPPYSGHSANRSPYATALVAKYKVEPGGQLKLQEQNSKWLNDDYVKFIAFSEDLIAKNPDGGILGMITNNGYLDNPTFRGMRWRLTSTFDTIYVLDLHGSTKKRESTASRKDVNVFDVQQGVAIIVAVKDGTRAPGAPATVKHAEMYGTRAEKFGALDTGVFEFTEVDLDPKFYFFQPRSSEGRDSYRDGIPLDKIFHRDVIGLFTGRDKLTIDRDKDTLHARVLDFISRAPEDARTHYKLGKDVRDWQVAAAQKDAATGYSEDRYIQIAYRPFDVRWTYYTGKTRGFYYYPRTDIMRDLRDSKDNYALIVGRQGAAVGGGGWSLAYVARNVIDLNIFYRGGGTVFPARVRGDAGHWTSNVQASAIKALATNLSMSPAPEAVIDYVYGVLNSPVFRRSAREFLKSDFPIIPIPSSDETFSTTVTFGARLRGLHLLEAPDIQPMSSLTVTFPEVGTNVVAERRYDGDRVWINKTQYFGCVSAEVWNYTIGGYQVTDKWLKDRKGTALSAAEIRHYQRTLTAIRKATDAVQSAPDSF